MINAKVNHVSYGEGTVIDLTESKITVKFEDRESKFIFPNAFNDYLTTDNRELINAIRIAFAERQRQEIIEEQKAIDKIRRTEPKVGYKNVERSNIAFKCNYCDGGQSSDSVGFKNVCSDNMIVYNIEHAHHIWCSSSSSPCKKYTDGEITRTDLEALMCSSEYNSSVCYESKMLRDWKASAGVIQTGVNKGKPMRLLKVQKNSLAVLTTRDPYTSENERYVFAAFLVDENYQGDGNIEGYVSTGSRWKIELTSQEAHTILFWNYYVNQNQPMVVKFGSGLHRYLSDEQAAQILRDIAEVKTNVIEKEFALQFFEHFCTINRLDVNSIPNPNGALINMA